MTAESFANYEDVLCHDLEWEGIGLHRKLQTVLSASRLFRALNARLMIVVGVLRGTILEEAFLSVAPYRNALRRGKERRVLKPIFHDNQIPLPELKSLIQGLRAKFQKRLRVGEFEEIVIDLFKDLAREVSVYEDPVEGEQRNDLFLSALGKLRSEAGDQDLNFHQWIEAWQEVTQSIRLPIRAPVENGVWGVDLNSVEDSPADYLIVLGAVEKGAARHALFGGDKLNYFKEKGFDFEDSFKKKTDPLYQWVISSGNKKVVLSCPKTDSSGQSVAASAVWLRLASQNKKDLDTLDFARKTNWIEAQRLILQEDVASQVDLFKSWEPGATKAKGLLVSEELNEGKKINLGAVEAKPLQFALSASRLEAYWECPFKFFARAHLALFDEEDLEIEPSVQKKGQWLHTAVEKILGGGRPLGQWSDEDLEKLIDSLDEVQKQVSSDIWPSIRLRFVRQIRRFIQFELEWQKLYPGSKPFKLEAPIDGIIEWSQESSEISFGARGESQKQWARYKGSIDRIDTTALDEAVIIDYKSGTSAGNISSWVKNGKFQLALYAQAIEAGLHDGKNRKVLAAQYYSLKKLMREKGFKRIDENLMGILPTEKSGASVDEELHQKYFGEINESVHGILEKIRGGEMTPVPHSEKICTRCSWRMSCRAHHLS